MSLENIKVLLLNGPPRSGKDTLAEALWKFDPDIHLEKFAKPLKDTAPILYGISREEWRTNYDTAANKDYPTPAFFGKSPREVQIAISENLLKPLHGKDVFGRLLVSRISRLPRLVFPPRLVVVSDSGFRAEAEKVVEAVGKDNVFLCRLYRKGCTFAGDSRGYITLSDLGVREVELQNSGGVDDLRDAGERLSSVLRLPREQVHLGGGPCVPEPEQVYQARVDTALAEWRDRYENQTLPSNYQTDQDSTGGGGSW